MKIKIGYQVINNMRCKEYCIRLEDGEYQYTKKGMYNRIINPDEKEKYLGYIREQIPEEEKIIIESGFVNGLNDAVFSIYTKEKRILNRESEVKHILEENGYEVKDYDIDISENNWLELDGRFPLNKEHITKIYRLLDAEDFEVVFDCHMERVSICFKLKEDIEQMKG